MPIAALIVYNFYCVVLTTLALLQLWLNYW